MKCHWATHTDGIRYWIPGCEPGWYNAANCICRPPRPPKEPDPRDTLINELEAENARLNRLLYNLLKRSPTLSEQ